MSLALASRTAYVGHFKAKNAAGHMGMPLAIPITSELVDLRPLLVSEHVCTKRRRNPPSNTHERSITVHIRSTNGPGSICLILSVRVVREHTLYGRSYREHVTFHPLRGTKRTASSACLRPSKGDHRVRRPKRRSCPPSPNLWIADPSSAWKGRISLLFRNWIGNGIRLRSIARRIHCSAWLPPSCGSFPIPQRTASSQQTSSIRSDFLCA